VWNLWFDREAKPLGVTALHPIWSVDRSDWVAASELRVLERVRVEGGTRVLVRREYAGEEPVCNLEVDGDHCYRVGEQGLLVHNASCPPATGEEARRQLRNSLGPSTAFPAHVSVQAHHIFPVSLFNTPLGEMLCCWGIDLNSAENGVWLPSCEYRGRAAALHSGGPPGWYNGYVQQEFANATDKTSALIVIKRIRSEFLSGNKQLNVSAKPC
jgi:A nuclease family of the HNH/ENDO VII superfamily with conserved AHH